jgi:hypothetical protein
MKGTDMKMSRTMLAAALFGPTVMPQASRYPAQTVREGKTRDQRDTERAQATLADDAIAANRAQNTNGRRAFHDGRKLDENLFFTAS